MTWLKHWKRLTVLFYFYFSLKKWAWDSKLRAHLQCTHVSLTYTTVNDRNKRIPTVCVRLTNYYPSHLSSQRFRINIGLWRSRWFTDTRSLPKTSSCGIKPVAVYLHLPAFRWDTSSKLGNSVEPLLTTPSPERPLSLSCGAVHTFTLSLTSL